MTAFTFKPAKLGYKTSQTYFVNLSVLLFLLVLICLKTTSGQPGNSVPSDTNYTSTKNAYCKVNMKCFDQILEKLNFGLFIHTCFLVPIYYFLCFIIRRFVQTSEASFSLIFHSIHLSFSCDKEQLFLFRMTLAAHSRDVLLSSKMLSQSIQTIALGMQGQTPSFKVTKLVLKFPPCFCVLFHF